MTMTPTETRDFIGLVVSDNHQFLLADLTVVHDSTIKND